LIDNISLEELKEGEKCLCEQADTLKGHTTEIVKTQIVPSIYDNAIGKAFTIQNISFETNKTILHPSSYTELNNLAIYLKEHAQYKIELNGYTDNVGKEDDNLKLSEGRAKSVSDYLIQQGIKQGRISYKGFGNANPVADNKTEEGRAKNRRVEIILKN